MSATLLDKWRGMFAVVTDPRFSSIDKGIFVLALERMDGDGVATLGIRYVAEKVGAKSLSTCVRSINKLVAERKLVPVARRRGRPNRYRPQLAAEDGASTRQLAAEDGASTRQLAAEDGASTHYNTPNISLPSLHSGRERERAREATRLPDDWVPTPADAEFAVSLGLDAQWTLDKFRDYWIAKPGSQGRKLDWPATWRIWCRRDAESSACGGRSGSNGSGTSEIAAALRRIGLAPGDARAAAVGPMTALRNGAARAAATIILERRAAGETPIVPPAASHDLGEPGDRLARQLGPTIFQSWFSRLRVASLDAATLRLVAPSSFVRSRLISNYARLIEKTWGVPRVEIVLASEMDAA